MIDRGFFMFIILLKLLSQPITFCQIGVFLNVLTVERVINSLDAEYKRNEYFGYFNLVIKELRKLGLRHINSGAYSVVYSSKDFNYVVKILRHPGSGKYRNKYTELYLEPRFISKHRCIAIQKKVPILDDMLKPLYRRCHDVHDRNIGIVKGKFVMIDLD